MSDIYIDITDECSFTPSHGTELYDNTLLKVSYTDPETSKNYTISKNINVYPREEFNKPYKISSRVNDCSNMFAGCTNFNQPVNIGSNVDNCWRMFYGCESLNSDITIGKNVSNCLAMFGACYNFNSNVHIQMDHNNYDSTGINTYRMFYDCENLNRPITFPNNILFDHKSTFMGCRNLNSPINLGSNVQFMDRTFDSCMNFNAPVSFSFTSNTHWDFARCFNDIFYSCYNYNQSLSLPSRIVEAERTLSFCNNFNNHVSFSGPKSTLRSLKNFFSNCHNLNHSDIDLSSFTNLTNVAAMFERCFNFNKNVYLNWDIIENTRYMMSDCRSFNCFINSFRDGLANAKNLKDCSWMFYNCPMDLGTTFEDIIISNNIINCGGMFHSCSNIYSTGSFIFGTNVNNLVATFQDCNIIGNIYILQNQSCNVYAMLYNCPNAYIVNVLCHNLSIINKTSASESLTGLPMTWTYESTGTYFNSAYGIRITNQF